MNQKIGFIGGGNMGYALATRIAANSPEIRVIVADPSAEQRARFADSSIQTTADNRQAAISADVVVLAVKPQVMSEVLSKIQLVVEQRLVISVAAGVPLTTLEQGLGDDCAIVRCMPNTPALIGEGITGMIANSQVTEPQAKLAEEILSHSGSIIWFGSDRELDAVTAVSGSGPAYFFYLMEHMIGAAIELGLSEIAAKQLVLRTACGAAQMAERSAFDPATLREQVTSPGGTTERALQVLANAQADAAIRNALRGAFQRSIELAKGNTNP